MDAVPPSIPRYGRQPRHREWEDKTTSNPNSASLPRSNRPQERKEPVAPASPEVISSLITSLSSISKPAKHHFDLPLDLAPKPPSSPSNSSVGRRHGSFGVTYGGFTSPSASDSHADALDLDDLPAASPVIRTAKPPSGFSPLTAPKSPGSREGSGLRSFLGGTKNTSRPSSRGSWTSKDAETQSVGNISVERLFSPSSSPTQVRKQRSVDSWGKKAGRSHSRLLPSSSRERLRDVDDRTRNLKVATGGLAASAMARTLSPRSDSFLGETPITEESLFDGEPLASQDIRGDGSMSPARPIPHRDSSLRKTGVNLKRSSTRNSRGSKRDSDHAAIPEEDYFIGGIAWAEKNGDSSSNQYSSRRESKNGRSDGMLDPSWATSGKANRHKDQGATDSEGELDDGAPAPSIAQGKRRDREVSGDRSSRRRSGRSTPELRIKRSSSRMKRLSSGPLSPRIEDKSKDETAASSVSYERPASADSVDDAVEAYMRSPRLSQRIKHPQTGRVISFSEVGDSDGNAVFCCVGMGLTRYITAFYDELALTLKLRLITPDRPGVGDSEAYADGTATPLSWPDDVYAICQALKITKFSILAHSAGAIYALATALRMPQHIRGRIHLLAPWIPPSQMSVFGSSTQSPLPPTNAIPTSQKILRALPTPFLKAANSSFMSATSSSLTSSLPKQTKRAKQRKASGKDSRNSDRSHENGAARIPPDMPTLTREMMATEEMDQIRPEGASPTGALSPIAASAAKGSNRIGGIGSGMDPNRAQEDVILAAAESALADKERQESYDMRLTHAIWDLATTGANPAVDLLVCLERRHTIGFRYVDITRPVVIHHGSRDTRVPVENVKWLGKTMRRCEVRVLEGEGHGLMASATVMGTVLMEISKEWEDWNKATGQSRRGR